MARCEQPTDSRLEAALRDVFGFQGFLPHQEEVVRAILEGRDCFVVMPTGGGKSLCYQLPAHVLTGTCLVISPLISLMKDQVDAARATGLRASYLNSALSVSQKRVVEERLLRGDLDLLYVSPERFAMPAFIEKLRHVDLTLAAIDEAHCISEWGHDFRPDYLTLSRIVAVFPRAPVAAFTATATRRVQQDIVGKLGLRSPHLVRASFDRPNLCYRVQPKVKPAEQILRFVRDHPGEAGIVYRTTRKSVDQTAAMLVQHGIRALPYHAGLDDDTRARHQDAFNRDEFEVIVATIAFGMGIDKSNVRYVLHGDLPKSVESYYQETGRAGRDGEPAHCLLLFGYGDIPKIRYFIDQGPDEAERVRALRCIGDMVHYATVYACRRRLLLSYFGEAYAGRPHPGCCDVCAGEVDCVDATEEAQIVLSAIARTGQRFGINHIVDVVVGKRTPRLERLGHHGIKTFGAGRHRDRGHWRLVVDNLLAQDLLRQSPGDFPTLGFGPEARAVLRGERTVQVLQSRKTPRKRSRRSAAPEGAPRDADLFEILRGVRRRLAEALGVPPYIVFNDRTLREMTRRLPTTEDALLAVHGVGETRLERFGAPFLEAIRVHLRAGSSVTAPDPPGSSPGTIRPDGSPPVRDAGAAGTAPDRVRELPAHIQQARRKHPRAYERWSEEEDARLSEAYASDTPIQELAQEFGRQPGAIRSRLAKLGLIGAR